VKGSQQQPDWRETFDLELPDWSGHIERPSKMSADEMLRYCESLLPLMRKHPGRQKLRSLSRCNVEFRL